MAYASPDPCLPMRNALRLLVLLLPMLPAAAQPARPVEGMVVRRGWPHERLDERRARRFGVLPAMDTLALGYRVAPAEAAPLLDLAFRWTPGTWGILDGARVPYRRLPEGVRLVGFVLTADVLQRGQRVAGFSFEVDSTRLSAGEVLRVTPAASWDRLFDGTSAAEARRIVAEGFTLHNLRLTRAAFAVYSRDRRASRNWNPQATHRTAVILDGTIDAAWRLAWLFDDRGYGPLTRRADEDDEDAKDDDDHQLLPAALAGLAAVAAVAYEGGSAGVYGAQGAPIGVAAGRTGRTGGVLVQVGVNLGVLAARDEPERLQGRLLAYRTGWRSPVGPFVAVGAEVRERVACYQDAACVATDALRVTPLLSGGLALRAGRLTLLGGLDLLRGRGEFGAVVRMR